MLASNSNINYFRFHFEFSSNRVLQPRNFHCVGFVLHNRSPAEVPEVDLLLNKYFKFLLLQTFAVAVLCKNNVQYTAHELAESATDNHH